MGNKDAGRAVAALPNVEYMRAMGFDVDRANIINSGISFFNHEVYKYFKTLRLYALNRIRWTSNAISEIELRLIEWNIFHFGRCAMLKPRIPLGNRKFYRSPEPRIFQCNFIDINERTGQPSKINITNYMSTGAPIIDTIYYNDEFVIFTDEFLYPQNPNPFSAVAWEFACKLHELDLAFKANSNRNRMPFVFNDASPTAENERNPAVVFNRELTVAEIMRSAYGRNEAFVSIPESMVGKDKFMHEPQYVKNDMLDHIKSQKELYQAYLELLGLYTDKEKGGAYTVKRLQEDGDESPDYITECMKSTRILCAEKAATKFSITLNVEVR